MSCEDFRARNGGNKLFLCKHLAATSISGIQLARHGFAKNILTKFDNEKPPKIYPSTPDKKILEFFNDEYKKQVNLDVNLTVDYNNAYVDFRIGSEKMYVLKSLKDFANSKLNNTILSYGKNFTYDPNIHYFSNIDEPIVDIIEEYGNNYLTYLNRANNSKLLNLGISGLKRFLMLLKDKDFTLNYNDITYNPSVYEEPLPISFKLDKSDNKIKLYCENELPTLLTSKGDVVLYENDLYLLNNEDAKSLKNFMKF